MEWSARLGVVCAPADGVRLDAWEWSARLGMECVWTFGNGVRVWEWCARLGMELEPETRFNYDRTPPGRTSGEERAVGGCKIVSFLADSTVHLAVRILSQPFASYIHPKSMPSSSTMAKISAERSMKLPSAAPHSSAPLL